MLHWKDLTGLSNDQLGALDVAEVNLACAADLPGAPDETKAAECIDRLNHYAKCAAHYTQVRMTEFLNRPEVYRDSEGIFRMVCLVRLLQGQFGVRYNVAKIPEDAPFYAEDVFIHGALLGDGGTCASLPVVYAAVGRRLGYPLKLASALRHQFVRWDDSSGERFNIEVNNNSVDSPPDEYYRKGRYEVTPEVERLGCLLRSHTPREDMAAFLAERGLLLRGGGRHRQAVEAYAWASALWPENEMFKGGLGATMNAWAATLRAREPPGFPKMWFTRSPRRFPATLPWDYEKNVNILEAWDNLLTDPELDARWWEPMRRSQSVVQKPSLAVVVCRSSGGCDISFRFN